jgi:hypothetical protein
MGMDKELANSHPYHMEVGHIHLSQEIHVRLLIESTSMLGYQEEYPRDTKNKVLNYSEGQKTRKVAYTIHSVGKI